MNENIVIYARISTREGKQFLANQLQALQRYVAAQPLWRVVQTITDEHTGSKEAPGWRQVIALAQRRRITRVCVWKLDRVTRQGPSYAFRQIHALAQYGCSIVSLQEPMFDSAGAFGSVLIAIAAWIAEQESTTQRERVKAGLNRARSQGKKLGRPVLVIDKVKLAELRSQGKGLDLIARALRISRASANRYIKQLEERTSVVNTDRQTRQRNESSKPFQPTSANRHSTPHQAVEAEATARSARPGNRQVLEIDAAATRRNSQAAASTTATQPASANRRPADTAAAAAAQNSRQTAASNSETKTKRR
jgi:DNA invertase Pin-like site-specific DNA recombinase